MLKSFCFLHKPTLLFSKLGDFLKEKKKHVGVLLNLLSQPLHPMLGLNPCFFTVPADRGSHHVFLSKNILFLNLDTGVVQLTTEFPAAHS